MANFTVFRNFKLLRKILLFFLIIPFLTFSQVEISKRKIELLPPVSSALKNAQISPNNPNYFSISKKTESKKMSSALKENETFLNPGDIYLKRLKKEKDKKPNGYSKGSYLGDVSTVSEYVNILCRDFEYVDGDRVRILVNDLIK